MHRDLPALPGSHSLWCVLLTAFFCGCDLLHDPTPAIAPTTESPPLRAELVQLTPSIMPTVLRAQGNLAADDVAVVGAKVAGRVESVEVDLGDVVAASEPLATLVQAEFLLQVDLAEAQLAQARAALGLAHNDPLDSLDPLKSPPVREARSVWDEAKSRVQRLRQLHERNAVTQDEVDLAIAAEGVADARYSGALNGVREKIALIGVRGTELDVARQRLADTVIRAPFAGRVLQRHAAPGAFLQLGDPVATIVREQKLRFRGSMPERHAHRLALGQPVTLTIESAAEPRRGKITRISPVLEELSRALSFEVEIDNADGSLQAGLFAEAEVVIDPAAEALLLPREAVVEFAGTRRVWLVEEGVARQRSVFLGRRTSEGVEVLEGLAPGDVVLRHAAAGRAGPIEAASPASAADILQAAAAARGENGAAE